VRAEVAETAPAAQTPTAVRRNWHRFRLLLAVLAWLALAIAVAIYGFDYYTLDGAHRVGSAKHSQLRPSGDVGHSLGIL